MLTEARRIDRVEVDSDELRANESGILELF
jgi:hypothetical protein